MTTSSAMNCTRSPRIAPKRSKFARQMTTIALYPLLTTALYYLFARATITRFLWSRYPSWLDYYTSCSACSGFLYGVVVAVAIGWSQDLPFLGLPGRFWMTPIAIGLCSIVWTPLLADLHVRALYQLGTPTSDTTPTETDPDAQA